MHLPELIHSDTKVIAVLPHESNWIVISQSNVMVTRLRNSVITVLNAKPNIYSNPVMTPSLPCAYYDLHNPMVTQGNREKLLGLSQYQSPVRRK